MNGNLFTDKVREDKLPNWFKIRLTASSKVSLRENFNQRSWYCKVTNGTSNSHSSGSIREREADSVKPLVKKSDEVKMAKGGRDDFPNPVICLQGCGTRGPE